MNEYTSIEEKIALGLDTIDPDRKIDMPLRDLMYIFKTFSELNRFFHQNRYYQKIQDIERSLGNQKAGAYAAIHRCLYDVLSNALPEDISQSLDERERIENPNPPYYYEHNEKSVGKTQGNQISSVSVKCNVINYRKGFVEITHNIHDGCINLETWGVHPDVDITMTDIADASFPDAGITGNTELEMSVENTESLINALQAAVRSIQNGE